MFNWVGRHKTGWARCIAAGTYFGGGVGHVTRVMRDTMIQKLTFVNKFHLFV